MNEATKYKNQFNQYPQPALPPDVIVSRHPATIDFIAEQLGTASERIPGSQQLSVVLDNGKVIPVIEQATPEDVRGKIVAGNLPLHLASLAAAVVAVEFSGDPPRGREYTLKDMLAAGARLSVYGVHCADDGDLRSLPCLTLHDAIAGGY